MTVRDEINRQDRKGALPQGRLDSTEQGICLQGNIEGRTAKLFIKSELQL